MEPQTNICVLTYNDSNHTLASVLTSPTPITQSEWSSRLNAAMSRFDFIEESDEDKCEAAGVTADEIAAWGDGFIGLFLFQNAGFESNETAAEYSY